MNQIITYPLSVHLIIERDNKILFLKRENTGSFDGYWCLPTGKIEENESPRQAIIREAKEEIGLDVNPELATIIPNIVPNIYKPKLMYKNICLFFKISELKDEPINMEPDKHSEVKWFSISSLPTPILDVIRQGIYQYKRGVIYEEFGY